MDAYTAFFIKGLKHFSDVEHYSSDFIVWIERIIEVIDAANFSNFIIFGRIYGKHKFKRS